MYTPKRRAVSSRTDDSPLLRKSINSLSHTLNTSVANENDSFNRSTIFQVLKQEDDYELQTYGNVIPVKVTNVLSENSAVSCNISNNGWAVVVSDKKIYAWRYTIALIKKMVSCFMLQLPSTELSHSALLTCVLQSEEYSGTVNNRTSVINVSPEGVIRYWLNIARLSSFIDIHIDLKGKQCHQLISVMPYGCIMLTTTKEMFLLTPTQTTVICQELTVSSGIISGLSRRVSSFWGPEVSLMNKHTPCLCDGTLDQMQYERYFFIGDKSNIQKWQTVGTKPGDSKMLCEVNLTKLLKSVENCSIQLSGGEDIQVIDLKNAGFGTLALIAVWRQETVFDCYLVLLKIHSQETSTVESVKYLDYNFEDINIEDIFLELPPASYRAYVHTPNVVLTLPVLGKYDEMMTVPFSDTNNCLLGAGYYGNDVIFLHKKHGLISLKVNQFQQSFLDEPFSNEIQMNESTNQFNSTTQFNSENYDAQKNTSSYFRQAFLHYSKNNKKIASLEDYIKTNIDNLVEIVKTLSEEIIDSSPATDTTWASTNNETLQSSSALLINQLNDKLQIFETFQKFLENHDIFNLASSNCNKIHATICEHGEKLNCCMTLLQMYPEHEELLNTIINVDLDESADKIHDKDKLFTQVTNIGHLFGLLVSHERENIKEMRSINNQMQLISTVSSILLNFFRSAWEFRQNYHQKYNLSENIATPWTGSSHGDNNREMLKVQIGIILKQALPHVDTVKSGSFLCQCAIVLSDVLLDGFQRELNSEGSTLDQYTYESINEDFYYQRENICHSLVNLNYNEAALTLAEKYEDFPLMITICEKTNKVEKIEEYKHLYQNQGFSDVLYNYYMEKGAWGKLMSLDNTSEDFEKFLRNHKDLSWIHFIGKNEFSKASNVLKSLAEEEEMEVERKKMMLVLSNLSMLASSESNDVIESSVAQSDRSLAIIEYQTNILKALQKEHNAPLKPEDILEICIADDENIHDDKFYIYLLELLLYVETDSEELQAAIWKKILDADRWDEQSMIDYGVVLKQKTVYKCLDYISQKDNFASVMASLKNLIMTDTSSISETCRSHVKACWELLHTEDVAMSS